MSLDLFSHFVISHSKLGFGITNLAISEAKCLLLFLIFAISCRVSLTCRKIYLFGYYFICNVIEESLGKKYSSLKNFFVGLFLFILFSNLYGILPEQFSFNSHLIVTMTWAILIFFIAIICGLYNDQKKFFGQFIPKGVPIVLLFLLTPIKFISFFIKPISLGLRLFANVFVGHLIMSLVLSFVGKSICGTLTAFISMILMTFVEFAVSILQSYIFMLMSCYMVKDCLGIK